MHLVDEFYDENIFFRDPLVSISKGLPVLGAMVRFVKSKLASHQKVAKND